MTPSTQSKRSLIVGILIAVALTLAAIGFLTLNFAHAEAATAIPAPQLDNPKATASMQKAVLAGGCFWGTQGVFQHVKGVTRVVSGYSGGDNASAVYGIVSTGLTGHAESIEVTFDPAQISYGEILRIFFSVAHNPTELNRQGPDHGPQYRSAIFYADEQQKKIATAYIKQLSDLRVFNDPIVTRVDPLKGFYPAENYHQDYLVNHPEQPYIVYNDLPKIENLKHMFPSQYRDKPVLVADKNPA